MLKEKSSYQDDLPVNIRIVEIEEYPLHFHQDIEFVYVLKGEINLKCGYFTYRMTEGSIFTINGREVHGLYQTEIGNTVALIQIDNYFFSHYFSRLSGSCFRTYTTDSEDKRLDSLRRFFVNILLESMKKEPGYKRQLIDLVNELILYLDEFFHYFSFENNVVVNTRNDNPVKVERLGRITSAIYEKHSEKLTLEDLSRQEHLSTYYISHLITESTGMSFRDFLGFARVEFSEMALLDTNKKINVIAQEVGFSTTAYYIKYFKKWFGMTPEEYRERYHKEIKAPNIPAKMKLVETDRISKLLRPYLSSLPKQLDGVDPSEFFPIVWHVNCNSEPLGILHTDIIPHCNASLLSSGFQRVLRAMHELNITEITVIKDQDHIPNCYEELSTRLLSEGLHCSFESPKSKVFLPSYGMDSCAAASYILRQGLNPGCKSITMNSILDQTENGFLLNGEDGIFTAGLVPKPSFYAYKMLQHMDGELIHWGKYHAVVRKPNGSEGLPSYCIACYNHHEEIDNLCKRPSSPEEAGERISGFNHTLNIGIHLDGLSGIYRITKYRLSSERCLLNYSINNGIHRKMRADENPIITWFTAPQVDIATETVSQSLFVSLTLRGLDSQCILIEPLPDK